MDEALYLVCLVRHGETVWQLFRDGWPGGETPEHIGAAADRIVHKVQAVEGDVLVFWSAHFLRVLAARWLGLEPEPAGTSS